MVSVPSTATAPRLLQILPRSLRLTLQVDVAAPPPDSDFPSREILYSPCFSPAESLEEESNQVFKLVSSPWLRGSGSEAVSCWLTPSGRLPRDTTYLPWQHRWCLTEKLVRLHFGGRKVCFYSL